MAKKLTDEQTHIILKQMAEGSTPTECVKFIKDTWQIEISSSALSQSYQAKKYESFVKKCKDDYLKKIKDIPIANKRIRVDDLEKVRLKLMKVIEENKCQTKSEKEEFRQMVRTLNDIIINAREEMEKKPNLVPVMGIGDFSDKSDDALIAERDELIKQAERFISGGTSEASSAPEGTQESDSIESP